MREYLKRNEAFENNIRYFVKWSVYAIFTGALIGGVGMVFRKGVDMATANWKAHPQMMFLAPVSVCLILLFTKLLHEEKNGGTNTVIDSITEGKHITEKTAPLIFCSTILSHLVGASVGKEGAALMVGGSLGELFSGIFHFDEKDKKIAIMCGMSACFAAIFGTPMAATIFPMEMISIGVMYYAALIPCMFASFFGAGVSLYFGNHGEVFPVETIPVFDMKAAMTVVLFGIVCAVVSVFFSVLIGTGHKITDQKIPNPWIRGICGAAVLIILTALNYTFLTGGFDFNGGGFPLVEKAMEGEAPWYSFLLKMVFTCVCIWSGFKGGEIVPTFCIGGCLGCLFAKILGLDPALYTACGMVALFVGMTNCPISSLLIAFELFGYAGMPYYAMVIAVCFTLSGYYGLYSSQRFSYSKTRNLYINRKGPRKQWKD